MTQHEIEQLLAMLEAYYPGDWPPHRQLVWGRALVEIGTYQAAADAIDAMARADRYPTVAALHDHAGRRRRHDGGPTHGDGWLFLPGTGRIPDQRTTTPELDEHTDNVVELRQIRAQLRRHRDTA